MGKQRTRLPALTTLEAVKEALDVRLGRRGDKLDSAVTFRDLEESGAFNLVPRGGSGIGIARPSPNAGGPIMPDWFGVDVDLTTWVPPAPTGFLATAMFDGIFIEWDWPPKFGVVGHTEVYRSTTNDASARKFLTAVDGLTYMDPISGEDEQEYFYWIRFRSMGDKVGPYTGPVSAVSIPLSATLIERLEGEINESLLAQHLRERIDLIDGEGGLVSQVQEQGDTFARQITQVQTEVDNNFGALQQRITSSFNEVSGKVESIYSLRINSNGRISGFGLSDDGFESVFGVEADRFYVSGSGSNDRPFMVSGGRVYIKDAAIANAAIDSAKIKNGAINNAKIAFAAIDEAKISDAAISSAKIKNGAISSAKIGFAAINSSHIGYAAIDSSHIGYAAINSSHIGYAEVDTLQIKGQAVTIPASSSTNGSYTPLNNGWSRAQIVWGYDSYGAPTTVTISFRYSVSDYDSGPLRAYAAASISARLLRWGRVVHDFGVIDSDSDRNGGGSDGGSYSARASVEGSAMLAYHFPGGLTGDIELQLHVRGDSRSVSQRHMILLGTRR
jgi:hypothetical protein